MAKQKRNFPLGLVLGLSILVPFGLSILSFLVIIGFTVSYIHSHQLPFLILTITFTVFYAVGVVVFLAIFTPKLYRFFYDTLYKTTKRNYDNLYSADNRVEKYPDLNIKEFKELNNELEVLEARLNASTLVTKGLDYKALPLVKFADRDDVVTFESFKDNLYSMILGSLSYRNVVLEVYYDLENDEEISEHLFEHNLDLLESALGEYEQHLFAISKNKKNIYAYLPFIDSFSRIEEQLTSILDEMSITVRTPDGFEIIPAKVVLVAYPYSDKDEIFHDLRYAKNTDKIIHTYLPRRMLQTTATNIRNSTSNLNVVSKVVESLGGLNASRLNVKENHKIIAAGIKEFSLYLGIDQAGVILFNKDTKKYNSAISFSRDTFTVFQEGNLIDTSFINALTNVADFDKSYYFSMRNNANTEIGRHLDRYNIDSGFYYVALDQDVVVGVIYFFNKKKDLLIDSYIREGLVLFSSKVGDYLIKSEQNKDVLESYEEIDAIMQLTDYSTYRIDKETREIVSFAKNLKEYFPNVEEKQPCYKCLYGLERPCSNCPLSKGVKSESTCNGRRFETSLTLVKNNKSRYVRMLVKLLKDDEQVSNRYQKDLLINSFAALDEDLANAYSVHSRGHLLLLRFDNLDELIDKYNSENVLSAMRRFVKNVKNSEGGVQNIYYYNPQTLAIMFKEEGQIDVVNKCEVIYEESKRAYFDEWENDRFNITYLPIAYPAGYPFANDFLKHTFKFFEEKKSFEANKDLIYLEENGYIRPASRRDFMLDVIQDKFGNQTFNALLQPYVVADDRRVYGAEMLLRLTDDYRKIVFNADELIRVAAANKKISVISDALINFVANLYEKQGSSIFKVFGLKRISINTDFSYFQDEDAVNRLVEVIEHYHFPKGFLGFEIAEWDIKNHFTNFQAITGKLVSAGITLICDQYSGKDLSIDKLKELRFSEVKVGRSIGGFLDSDPQKCQAFTTICETAKALGVQVSVVGIENSEQYDIVRNIEPNAFLQGFYFYKPLEKNALINALRAANTNFN